jgi:uncharacterized protein involved in exopolysaccharide biosynthesis
MSESKQSGVINVIDIIRFIRKYFILFVGVGIFGIVAGYALSFRYQEEYSSTAVVLPEYSATSSASLGELASLSRILGRSKTEAVRPDLYPDILTSNSFLLELASKEFNTTENTKTTLLNLLYQPEDSVEVIDKKTVVSADSIISLSKSQHKFIRQLGTRVKVDYGKLTGVITINSIFPDRRVAAEVTRFAIDYLEKFVSEYRTGKTIESIASLEERMQAAKKDYYDAEFKLNSFRDRNRNTFTNLGRLEEQRLETEHNRSRSVYLDAAQKLEAGKQQLLDLHRVLKVLDPPVVPHATVKPRRLIMAAISGVLFTFGCLVYVLFFREKIITRLLIEKQ